ncbi:dihydrodipicolinate synthase family protein [Silicimonas algicola]|uniref:4-hydroxy-tetrahydrodipicolinate synthase n=1 Tax=Silicimonas algicola TaxID=1826607 RepID=A0A316G4F5_9RHOB|nr:dihydrodipicolinate synthase family protein [Silicimonas algicola]AZQ68472.1 dihydrodipicolinate synthase family protein [Silicimonas algicola]PWK55824.1 4-hydroxy-tetrahydrodipicolinate synthase [Silicimonas algicola]
MKHAIHGVHSAAATPVTGDGTPDLKLFGDHCRRLLEDGCHGIAMLGTTGEANSFGVRQRIDLVEAAIAGGTPANALLPGTSTPAVADTVELTRHAVQSGAKGVVMLPPYYYKGVSDEGLFRFYARVIEAVADDRLRIVLYHIPQVSQIPLSHALIGRLLEAFPGIVTGIKDSSGDMNNMRAMCETFPALGVLAGADPLMLPLLRLGGAGCITATSNVRADALRIVWDGWNDPAKTEQVEAAQARIDEWRTLSNKYVQLPTIKTMLAKRRGDMAWLNLMPPLVELPEAERNDIWAQMDRLGG